MKYILIEKDIDEKETELTRDMALKLLKNNYHNAETILNEMEKALKMAETPLTFTKIQIRKD